MLKPTPPVSSRPGSSLQLGPSMKSRCPLLPTAAPSARPSTHTPATNGSRLPDDSQRSTLPLLPAQPLLRNTPSLRINNRRTQHTRLAAAAGQPAEPWPQRQEQQEQRQQQQQQAEQQEQQKQFQQQASTAPSPAAEQVEQPAYSGDFIRRRLLVFASIVLGYSSYYLTRNSLTYTAPVMVADPKLGMDITQVGAMTSIFPIAYGMSKFVSGVLGARFSPSVLLAGGLMSTALINIAFGFGTSLTWFCFFWALNGTLQGVGGPCCARILTTWFASKERGTYWGMWNIAHNLGGFVAPLVAGGFAKSMGWQWGMWAPGIIGLIVGSFVLLACKDKPESLGFLPVEEVKDVKPKEQEKKEGEKTEEAPKPSIWEALVKNVLKNPFIWGMALTYFFIYVVRQGVTSWFVFYLIKAKGVEDAAQAGLRVSGLELGGLFGSLLAGKISDWLISRSKGKGGNVGKRVQVVMMYTVGIAASLLCFQAIPASMSALQWLNVFMIGFFLYGPQMLIGLCGAELVGPDSVGASEGFLGWVAYLGAANAGIPLSIIVKDFGWGAYFSTLVAACGLALVLLWPMMNLPSQVQRVARRKARLEAQGKTE